jgi:hypothetical protein
MLSGEQERFQVILIALDYCVEQIAESKLSLMKSLEAGNVTAPLTLLEQSERDLDSLRIQVLRLRSEIESVLRSRDVSFGNLKLDGANKDILVMGLGMYELDLIKIAASSEASRGNDKWAGAEAKLRLIRETKNALDL